ncbi:MAG: SAF domain-containing protein [Nakamurella sp.]
MAASSSRPSSGAPTGPVAPTPRRFSRPRWLDPRIIVGLLLVIAAVVVGAKVVGSSKQTTPVWAAAHELAAGTVLTANDLVPVEVNLGGSINGYLDASTVAAGQALNREIDLGELVPAGALAKFPSGTRFIAISVDGESMPPGVVHGSKIDLYLSVGGNSSSSAGARTEIVARQVTVQSVTDPSAGGLSGASSSKYQLALLMDAKAADALVRQLPTGTPVILLDPPEGK